MKAALEFDRLSRRKNGTAGCWTFFFFSSAHEDICRAGRLRLEDQICNDYRPCRALGPGDGVPGKFVQRNDEATTEFCDFGESMCLASRVAKVECLANR